MGGEILLDRNTNLDLLLVGGVGRSGTSFLKDRIDSVFGESDNGAFESKMLCEPGGLLDLYHSYVDSYTYRRLDWAGANFVQLVREAFTPEALQPTVSVDSALAAAGRLLSALYEARYSSIPLPWVFRSESIKFLREVIGVRGGRYIIEKTPSNSAVFGPILKIYPTAKLLNIYRHPFASALSAARLGWFRGGLPEAAVWVRNFYINYMDASSKYPNSAYLNVSLEELVSNTGSSGARLRQFLGPDFVRLQTTDTTDPYSWVGHVKDQEKDVLVAHLREVTIYLGYDPRPW